MKEKCIVMLSGGLDSRLVAKIMQRRGFDVTAIYDKYPFSKNVEKEIKEFCREQKVRLKIFDFTKGKLLKDYLKIIRKPCYGRGTAMNPCIDCRILGLKQAKKFADKEKIRFIATGEVMGQRPMSQMEKSMKLIKEKSRLKNRLLRPLEDYRITGRQRKKQIQLAKRFRIKYPHPAGGCLLCEKEYCKKLKNILKKNLTYEDIKLLKIGRHFENSNIILGKNKEENDLLKKSKGIKIIPKQPAPTALIKNRKYMNKAKKLIQKYSKHKIKGFEVR